FLGCGKFPRCRTIISMKQFDNLKELQEKGIWPPKTYEEADELLGRTKKKASSGKSPSKKSKGDKTTPAKSAKTTKTKKTKKKTTKPRKTAKPPVESTS
ncbi:MAG: hypothetical protein KAJ46_05445, partial [Sedimentisphaerales bacterium]|nr:hypothetical protein [Sedimentisphaerales bacterium]